MDHWNVWLGATLVCDVTRTDRFLLDSPAHDLVGAHSSLEGATAQIHAWVRWTNLTSGVGRREHASVVFPEQPSPSAEKRVYERIRKTLRDDAVTRGRLYPE